MFERSNFLGIVYLGFAILGAILTALANIDFVSQNGPGFDILLFIQDANINPAAQSLSRDLFVSASAFMVWIFVERKRLKMRHVWIALIGTITIAFAFGAPFFLFLRERRILEIEREKIDI